MASSYSENLWQTYDIALAATLALWVPLNSIDRFDNRRSIFNFPSSNELGKLVTLYREGRLEVEPRAYFDELRELKTRLHEGRSL